MITLDKMQERLERIEALLFTPTELAADLPRQELQTQRVDRLGAIAESQGKLLAAIHDARDSVSQCDARNVEELERRLSKEFAALSGQLKGFGDGLADEIGLLRKEQEALTALCIATWNYCIKHGVVKPKQKETVARMAGNPEKESFRGKRKRG